MNTLIEQHFIIYYCTVPNYCFSSSFSVAVYATAVSVCECVRVIGIHLAINYDKKRKENLIGNGQPVNLFTVLFQLPMGNTYFK